MITSDIKEKFQQLYKSSKKIELDGHGNGWVDLAAFGWAVNKAHINYRGTDGNGKLAMFLKASGLFEVITVRNKFIRLINANTNIPDQDDTQKTEEFIVPETQIEEGKPKVKQLTIFEEEQCASESTLSLSPCEQSIMCLIDEEKLELFQHLKEAKQEDWKTFSKPDYIGIWKSIIEKYPETAHFIYELIQNADDAQATEAAILLCKDKLIFKHNGKRQFSLTDPNNHDEHMGDINSITSVACSTKKDEEQTIGKFGVGFKSVFQYTESPAIYDDTYWFRIENYIIPNLLEEDHELRHQGETLFEIPFRNPEKAYKEIYDRLKNLKMPVLFLPHVARIIWKVEDDEKIHEYSKHTLQSNTRNGITYSLCRVNDYNDHHFVYLFNRDYATSQGVYNISVGYFLNFDGSLNTKTVRNIYCFFPTSETFEGYFVSHAPFLLTDNRDSIKTFEDVNKEFLHGIAELSADALLCLRDISIYRNERLLEDIDQELTNTESIVKPLINDNVYHLVNIHSEEERNQYLKRCYLNVLRNNEIFLNRSYKYVSRERCLITTADLESLLNSKQIESLYGGASYDFVYLRSYRSDLRDVSDEIGITTFDNETLSSKLSASFMTTQKEEWIKRLLLYIEEKARNLWVQKDDSQRTCSQPQTRQSGWGYYQRTYTTPGSDSWSTLKFRFAPIAKTAKGTWIAPYTLYKQDANVILPFAGFEDIDAEAFGQPMDEKLFNEHKDFYTKIGLKKPSMTDYLEKTLFLHYDTYGSISDDILIKDFKFLYNLLTNQRYSDNLIKTVKSKIKLKCISNIGYYTNVARINELAISDHDFIIFVNNDSSIFKFVDCDYYAQKTDINIDEVISFLMRFFDIPNKPIVKTERLWTTTGSSKWGLSYSYDNFPKCAVDFLRPLNLAKTNKPNYEDYILEGYNINNRNKEWSHILWNYVLQYGIKQYSKATLHFYYYRAQYFEEKTFDSTYLTKLKNDKWIVKEDGTFCAPCEISVDDFHSLGYECNESIEEELGFWDYIKEDVLEEQKKLIQEREEKERTELIAQASEKGINVNEVLREAIDKAESSEVYTPLITSENRNALHTILNSMNNDEINTLASKLMNDSQSVISSLDVPTSIVNNIEPLEIITDTVGEENLPIVAEHVNDIMNWIFDEEKAPSMVRRIIGYIGKAIYQKYLEDSGIEFEKISNHLSDCDFVLENGTKYVRVVCTLKSIMDNKFPVGLSASQNAFLRSKKDAQIRIIRISLSDISVVQEYERIVGVYGKEDSPLTNTRLQQECDELASNYWNGADIEEFDAVSPEYAIKIERKN